jgi:hypothetical protein
LDSPIESYSTQLFNALRTNPATRSIVLKALPVDASANKNQKKSSPLARPTISGRDSYSILLADAVTKSWVYITAPLAISNNMSQGDKLLMYAANLIRFDDAGTASFKGDIAARAAIKSKILDQPADVTKPNSLLPKVPRTWTMTYGYFRTLRATLGVVRSWYTNKRLLGFEIFLRFFVFPYALTMRSTVGWRTTSEASKKEINLSSFFFPRHLLS